MVVFNSFRLAGDLVHLLSIVILLEKIRRHKSCAGISLKTQILYAAVFVTRYLDLFTNIYSTYNTILKIVFLASTGYTLYLVGHRHRATYDRENDYLRLEFILIPSAVLSFAFASERLSPIDVLWTFSIIVESVAILPQIFLLQKTGEVENLTADYIVALGLYRALYMLNWIYRWFTEPGYSAWVVWIFGTIQTALYVDFFYYYFISRLQGKKLVLPS